MDTKGNLNQDVRPLCNEGHSLPRFAEWDYLRQHGAWRAGVPSWARGHDGQMHDGIAMTAVIEELRAALVLGARPKAAPSEDVTPEKSEALRLADALDPFIRREAPDHLTSKVAADALRRLAEAQTPATSPVPARLAQAFRRGGYSVPVTLDEAIASAANIMVEDRIIIQHLQGEVARLSAAASAAAAPELVRALIDIGTGKLRHLQLGLCPDHIEGHDTRDEDCPACQVLTKAAAHACAPAPEHDTEYEQRWPNAVTPAPSPAATHESPCALMPTPPYEQHAARPSSPEEPGDWAQYVAGLVVAHLGGGVDDERITPIASIIQRRLWALAPSSQARAEEQQPQLLSKPLSPASSSAAVAWCSPTPDGKPNFGKGWMFSPVRTSQATLALTLASQSPAVAPLTDDQDSLFGSRSEDSQGGKQRSQK